MVTNKEIAEACKALLTLLTTPGYGPQEEEWRTDEDSVARNVAVKLRALLADKLQVPPQRTKLRSQCEEEVLLAARRYGRMKFFGIGINRSDDNVVAYSKSDVPSHTEHLETALRRTAESLVASMTIDEVNGKLQE